MSFTVIQSTEFSLGHKTDTIVLIKNALYTIYEPILVPNRLESKMIHNTAGLSKNLTHEWTDIKMSVMP